MQQAFFVVTYRDKNRLGDTRAKFDPARKNICGPGSVHAYYSPSFFTGTYAHILFVGGKTMAYGIHDSLLNQNIVHYILPSFFFVYVSFFPFFPPFLSLILLFLQYRSQECCHKMDLNAPVLEKIKFLKQKNDGSLLIITNNK